MLDLTNPDAFAHILERLHDLVVDYDVAYLKWDHNRDLVAAGHPATGAPAIHAQTLAVYRLLDELRARHPRLEIESCASGGGRIDLGILARTDRVHTSDNHDPLDRLRMLRWTGLLVPPEMLGSHVASPTSSVTGRTHDLTFRCAVALIGHFGIEWDVRELDDEEFASLAEWVAVYKRFRSLIQTGRVVGVGRFRPGIRLSPWRGLAGQDRSAVHARLTVRFARQRGADPASGSRRPAPLPAGDDGPDIARGAMAPSQLDAGIAGLVPAEDAPVLSGALLRQIGVDVLSSQPERAAVVHVQAVPE